MTDTRFEILKCNLEVVKLLTDRVDRIEAILERMKDNDKAKCETCGTAQEDRNESR